MNFKITYIFFGFLVVCFSLKITGLNAKPYNSSSNGFGLGKQKWGFVNVREGAHLFWWLHYTTSPNVTSPTDRPLAIWLQGGPGSSSTGFGNFALIGPLDLQLNPRNYTWVKDMNVLFIDSPVGAGFSYAEEDKYLTTTDDQISQDLIVLIREFYKKVPEFKSVPLHIFGESYGGKVGVEFAYLLNKEIEEGRIDCNLKSVTSVSGWISPTDSTGLWAPYLYQLGFVDQIGYRAVVRSTQKCIRAVRRGNFSEAFFLWVKSRAFVIEQTNGIDFYNVLLPETIISSNNSKVTFLPTNINSGIDKTLVKFDTRAYNYTILNQLMTGPVSDALNIPKNVLWGSQSDKTSVSLNNAFMRPVTRTVERLLNETSINVNIIAGQLDLTVPTASTLAWVNKLNWPHASAFHSSKRQPIGVENILEGYYKKYNNFTLYWVNRAGHMTARDNPAAMDFILQQVTNYNANNNTE